LGLSRQRAATIKERAIFALHQLYEIGCWAVDRALLGAAIEPEKATAMKADLREEKLARLDDFLLCRDATAVRL
jgi:hypothetical protein